MKKAKAIFYYAIGHDGLECVGSDRSGFFDQYTSYRALRRYGLTDEIIAQKLRNAKSSGMESPTLSIYSVGNPFQDSSYHLVESFSF